MNINIKRKMSNILLLLVFGLLLITGQSIGQTNNYPERSIEFVVPFPAGGGGDLMARAVDKFIHQENIASIPFAIENIVGGGGTIGLSRVVARASDPYIFGAFTSTIFS